MGCLGPRRSPDRVTGVGLAVHGPKVGHGSLSRCRFVCVRSPLAWVRGGACRQHPDSKRGHRGANGLFEWFQQAACKGETAAFFSKIGADLARARELCGGCPVQGKCFDHAMENPALEGVWAGVTATERRHLRLRAA